EVEGSQVDVYQVAELVPESALERTGAKVARQVFAHIPLASVEVLPAADAIIFGTPTRFGNMCAQMRNFLDQDRTAVAQRRPNRQGWKCIHVYSNSAWWSGNNRYQLSLDPAASGHGHCWCALFPTGSDQYERDYGRVAIRSGNAGGKRRFA